MPPDGRTHAGSSFATTVVHQSISATALIFVNLSALLVPVLSRAKRAAFRSSFYPAPAAHRVSIRPGARSMLICFCRRPCVTFRSFAWWVHEDPAWVSEDPPCAQSCACEACPATSETGHAESSGRARRRPDTVLLKKTAQVSAFGAGDLGGRRDVALGTLE
jgi:hypothetical protein